VQFLHDSKLLNFYKHEVEDLFPWIVGVPCIFTYYTPYLICFTEAIHMSKVLAYGKSSKVKKTFESTCYYQWELLSLFFKKLKLEKTTLIFYTP
jgi:hypothetical protein